MAKAEFQIITYLNMDIFLNKFGYYFFNFNLLVVNIKQLIKNNVHNNFLNLSSLDENFDTNNHL